MIFQELSKIKTQMVMNAFIFMVLGVLMIICPESYIVTMVGAMGSVMLILAIVGIFEFLGSKRKIANYTNLTRDLILGVAGTAILLFEIHSLYAVSIIFGVFLILYGLLDALITYIYGKNSGRKGWQAMIVLSLVLVVFGVLILIHPNVKTVAELFNYAGFTLLFSALISMLHFVWIWPVKD